MLSSEKLLSILTTMASAHSAALAELNTAMLSLTTVVCALRDSSASALGEDKGELVEGELITVLDAVQKSIEKMSELAHDVDIIYKQQDC